MLSVGATFTLSVALYVAGALVSSCVKLAKACVSAKISPACVAGIALAGASLRRIRRSTRNPSRHAGPLVDFLRNSTVYLQLS